MAARCRSVLTSERSSSLAVAGVVAATTALIVLRSLVFLQYEQSDFDADQAIVGLMARHLAEGRAWPLFFYGQLYMMGVQAWLAAPVFLLIGSTVFALKLPLLVINVLTGALLVVLLIKQAGLRAWQAGVAVTWFAALPPVTASRMVQAQGGTIEPLGYALLLWLLRQRPIAFGLLFAFGFLQREFTLFAVIAILLIEGWRGELFTRRRAAHWLVVLLVFLGARQTVGLLRHSASMFGPDAASPRLDDAVTNLDVVANSVCLAPSQVAGNVSWLLRENVPTFFGVRTQPAGMLINTSRPTGSSWGWLGLAGWLMGTLVVLAPRRAEAPLAAAQPMTVFPIFLVLTGGLGLAGVAVGCDVRDVITIRYHLLLALAPIGLTALALLVGPPRRWGRVVVMSTLAWGVVNVSGSIGLWREYRSAPPVSAYRLLADDLASHGDRHGWASYWVAYHVDFLSQERVQLSPTSAIRVAEYARQALRAGPAAVIVQDTPCDASAQRRQVAGWWVCREAQ